MLVGGLEHVYTFFIFPYIGNNHPNWLIFFRRVQTTNQYDKPRKELPWLPDVLFRPQDAQCFCCSNGHRHPETGKELPCDRRHRFLDVTYTAGSLNTIHMILLRYTYLDYTPIFVSKIPWDLIISIVYILHTEHLQVYTDHIHKT